jgi:hypothetical protein
MANDVLQDVLQGQNPALSPFDPQGPPAPLLPAGQPILPAPAANTDLTNTAAPNLGATLGEQLAAKQSPFLKALASNTNALTPPIPPGQKPEPGAWAKSLVGGLQSTLAGIGDVAAVGTIPPGSGKVGGILTGIARTAAAGTEREQQQNQQAQQNHRADEQLDIEKQKLALEKQQQSHAMAAAHIQELHSARIARNEDQEYQTKVRQQAASDAAPFIEAGSQRLGEGLTSDQINEQMAKRKLDLDNTMTFVDGHIDVVGPDGRPIMGEDGLPQQRETRALYTVPPEIKLNKDTATLLNTYGNGKTWQEGDVIRGPGDVISVYGAVKQARANQAVALNVEKVKAEIAEHETATQRNKTENRNQNLAFEKNQQNITAAKDFAPYLSAASGDPVIGLQMMSADPKAKDKVGSVEAAYGPGNLERLRQDELSNLQKTITDGERVLAEHSVPGATPLPADEEAEAKSEIAAAKAKRNSYLGLHPQDPPQFADSVKIMDGIAPDKRAATITSNVHMPPAAKIYLLRHYNLPVPPELVQQAQPQQPQQPQPSAQ